MFLLGVLLTHATVIRQNDGDWEYVIWAIGTGYLKAA